MKTFIFFIGAILLALGFFSLKGEFEVSWHPKNASFKFSDDYSVEFGRIAVAFNGLGKCLSAYSGHTPGSNSPTIIKDEEWELLDFRLKNFTSNSNIPYQVFNPDSARFLKGCPPFTGEKRDIFLERLSEFSGLNTANVYFNIHRIEKQSPVTNDYLLANLSVTENTCQKLKFPVVDLEAGDSLPSNNSTVLISHLISKSHEDHLKALHLDYKCVRSSDGGISIVIPTGAIRSKVN
ncbi:MAG: hypothetical protein JNM12_08765 [Alphaproteobacteria bacterium]|nr:hypothetical protein [Alphaproteobacteria bacterium]